MAAETRSKLRTARWESDVQGMADVEFAYLRMEDEQWVHHQTVLLSAERDPQIVIANANAVICEHVKWWDVVGDDGRPVPVEPDELPELSRAMRLGVALLVMDEARGAAPKRQALVG